MSGYEFEVIASMWPNLTSSMFTQYYSQTDVPTYNFLSVVIRLNRPYYGTIIKSDFNFIWNGKSIYY